MPPDPDEAALHSCNFLTSYKKHQAMLVQLATGVCLGACSAYKKLGINPPSLLECQDLFGKTLRIHPLYYQTIIGAHPYTSPSWYDSIAESLGRYVVRQNWHIITMNPCP